MAGGEASNGQLANILETQKQILEAINGTSKEPGMRQEVHSLKTRLVGFGPNEDGGLMADFADLVEKHNELAGEFAQHVGAENVSTAGRESRWKTFREIGGFIAIFITVLSGIVAMLTAVRQGL